MRKIHDVSASIMFVVSRRFHVSVTCKIYSNMTRIEGPVVQSSSSPDGMQSVGGMEFCFASDRLLACFFTFLFKTRSSEDRTPVFKNSHYPVYVWQVNTALLLLINHWWKFSVPSVNMWWRESKYKPCFHLNTLNIFMPTSIRAGGLVSPLIPLTAVCSKCKRRQ